MRLFTESDGGILLPIEKKPDKFKQRDRERAQMPQFTLRTFECYYESDVHKFEKLVRSKNAYWEGSKECTSLNWLNQPGIGSKYVCLYQYHEPIEMEVLC